MFEIGVTTHFSAAHSLKGYPGECAGQHGHNWGVEVYVRGEALSPVGLLADFRPLKAMVKSVLAELDHSDLSTLEAFRAENPTSENIARLLYGRLAVELNCKEYRVSRVVVRETPGTSAAYWESGA